MPVGSGDLLGHRLLMLKAKVLMAKSKLRRGINREILVAHANLTSLLLKQKAGRLN